MRIQGIIHQQVCQLKWHLLACLGLIMVLPIEEAVVNLKEGDGFSSIRMVIFSMMFAPLLAGLIACANVQSDLDEKRYIFWRSKPASVKLLITLKFFVGLIASFVILICPIAFGIISGGVSAEYFRESDIRYILPLLVLLTIMTYSLCFGGNVLVRSTARAWLIGMLLAGFFLVFPFMLPLGYRDFMSDIMSGMVMIYLVIMLVTSAAAFMFSLFASQYDWHLRTNLKSLLWVGGGLVFILMMLFSSQVANIRVLDEKEIETPHWWQGKLDKAGNRLIFQGQNYVDVGKKGISLHKIGANDKSAAYTPIYGNPIDGNIGVDSEGHRVIYGPRGKGYSEIRYPRFPNALYMDTGSDTYCFGIILYYRREGEGRTTKTFFEEAYLRSYKLIGNSWVPIDELDISDLIGDSVKYHRMAMRLIDNTLIACVNDSLVAVDITHPDELKEIDKKLDVMQAGTMRLDQEDRQKEFSIPLVPVEGISTEERIKLSIDLRYRFHYFDNYICKSSIVDIHNGKIAFFYVSYEKILRFNVIRWDREKAYCKFDAVRPLTFMEVVTWGGANYQAFVENGKLYCQGDKTLLVFDIRFSRRIRKLGHFVRMNYDIEEIAVLENGNMLLSVRLDTNLFKKRPNQRKTYLYLLENPE